MPTDRVHRLIGNKLARGLSRWHRPRRRPTGPSRAAPVSHPRGNASSRGALHQLGSITPPPSWCNTPLSGVTPLSNKHRRRDMPRSPIETRGKQISGDRKDGSRPRNTRPPQRQSPRRTQAGEMHCCEAQLLPPPKAPSPLCFHRAPPDFHGLRLRHVHRPAPNTAHR